MSNSSSQNEVLRDFIARECALLDAKNYDDWLALFADDARYWVPLLGAEQVDPFTFNSIAYEDRLLLQLRIERLKNPRAHSEHPATRCQHILQRSIIESNIVVSFTRKATLKTPFMYIEARGDRHLMLSGVFEHQLVYYPYPKGWYITQKRVNLLDAQRPLPVIQLFI
jgi:3-phenylpropionate/cinnamic acid dioxygenase small subunit